MKPFERDIPRFPATEFVEPKSGVIVRIAAEPIPTSMPTVNNPTIFDNEVLVRSLDLIAQYTTPGINSKARHKVLAEAIEFATTPENYDQLETSIRTSYK